MMVGNNKIPTLDRNVIDRANLSRTYMHECVIFFSGGGVLILSI